MAGRIRIGIGGWTFEPWRETFYPKEVRQKDELAYASRQLTTIEVNGTFYRTQSPATFAAWAAATPEGFVFALKAPRYATNRKVLAEAGEFAARFAQSGIAELGPKLGPINWQLAPTKKFDPEDFAAFLALLPKEAGGIPLRHAVEVRHETFRSAEAVDLGRRAGVVLVLAADLPHPMIPDPTADFVYARIMGTVEDEPTGYAQAALDTWAARARALAEGKPALDLDPLAADPAPRPRDVFLYVIGGHKAANPAAAKELLRRLG